MEEALRFFRTNEVWVYLILGLIGLYFVRKFIISWQELRGATFGLERDSAQGRLNYAASVLVLILTIIMAEFVLVSFVGPTFPGTTPLLTPTLDLLATPTITLEVTPTELLSTPGQGNPTPAPETQTGDENGCIPQQVAINFPTDGSEIRDIIDIRGTADIPNFGFYKLDMKRVEDLNWLTILAGNEIKQDAVLGSWNISLLSPGDYQLSLVVVDNQGVSLPACVIRVHVASVEGTPQP
jgi:hypothetical protein